MRAKNLINFKSRSTLALDFDNVICQTIAIFQKSSGFLEWEPISSNSERYIA